MRVKEDLLKVIIIEELAAEAASVVALVMSSVKESLMPLLLQTCSSKLGFGKAWSFFVLRFFL